MALELSARNQLAGTVTAINLGGVMAEVVVDIGNQEMAHREISRTSPLVVCLDGNR